MTLHLINEAGFRITQCVPVIVGTMAVLFVLMATVAAILFPLFEEVSIVRS